MAVLIDDFTIAPIVVERTGEAPGMASQSNLDSSRVVGGARLILVGTTGIPGQRIEIGNGRLSAIVPEDLFDAEITYGTAESPIGARLISDGSNSFRFELPSSGFINGSITVVSGEASGAGHFQQTGGDAVTVPFSSFPDEIDFADVTSLTLDVNRSQGFAMSNFRTVPEPCDSLMLFLISSTTLIRFGLRTRNRDRSDRSSR